MPAKKEKTASSDKKQGSFTCNFCSKVKPLSEMTLVTRFFPAVVACRACEKRLR